MSPSGERLLVGGGLEALAGRSSPSSREQVDLAQDLDHASVPRYWCTNCTDIEPSPDRARHALDRLVAHVAGHEDAGQAGLQQQRRALEAASGGRTPGARRSGPARMNPWSSRATESAEPVGLRAGADEDEHRRRRARAPARRRRGDDGERLQVAVPVGLRTRAPQRTVDVRRPRRSGRSGSGTCSAAGRRRGRGWSPGRRTPAKWSAAWPAEFAAAHDEHVARRGTTAPRRGEPP